MKYWYKKLNMIGRIIIKCTVDILSWKAEKKAAPRLQCAASCKWWKYQCATQAREGWKVWNNSVWGRCRGGTSGFVVSPLLLCSTGSSFGKSSTAPLLCLGRGVSYQDCLGWWRGGEERAAWSLRSSVTVFYRAKLFFFFFFSTPIGCLVLWPRPIKSMKVISEENRGMPRGISQCGSKFQEAPWWQRAELAVLINAVPALVPIYSPSSFSRFFSCPLCLLLSLLLSCWLRAACDTRCSDLWDKPRCSGAVTAGRGGSPSLAFLR